MLGFAPIAAAPLGALGDGGVTYDVAFSDAAVVADTAPQAFAAFAPVLSDNAVATGDAVSVTASIFNAGTADAAVGEEVISAAAIFLANLADAAQGTDSTNAVAAFLSVLADIASGADAVQAPGSTYNPTVSEVAVGADSVRAFATMMAAFSDSTTITDADMANYLWNIINTSQPSSWAVVKTQA